MGGLVQRLLDVPAPVAYALIGLLVLAEAAVFVGFVLPGETGVLLGGVLASQQKLSLPALLVLVVVAAIVGDSIGYEVGKHVGPRVLRWRILAPHEPKLDGARTLLRERGGWAILLARLTAFLRAVMPGLAGLSGMPYRRFLVFNAIGGLIWGVGVVLLGYLAGNSYRRVETLLGRSSAIILAVVVVLGVLIWHRRRSHRRDEVTGVTPDA